MPTPKLPELEAAVRRHLRELRKVESRAAVVDRRALDQAQAAAFDKLEGILARYETDGTIDVAALSTVSRKAGDLTSAAVTGATVSPGSFAAHLADAARVGAELATNLGALPNLTRVDIAAAHRLAGAMTAPGSPLTELLDRLGPDTGALVRDRLNVAMLTGENPRKAARRIMAEGADIARSRADTIARTEILRAQRAATRDRLADAGVVTEWIWYSAADDRTCAACWAMHGTRHPIKETLDGHPNCRCTMVPAIPGGIADNIPTGDELLAELTPQQRVTILGPKRAEQWNTGRAKLGDFVNRRSSPKWGTMRTVAPFDPSLDRRPDVGPTRREMPSKAAGRRAVLDQQHTREAAELGVTLADYRSALEDGPRMLAQVKAAARRVEAEQWDELLNLTHPAQHTLPRPPAGRWEALDPGAGDLPGIRRYNAQARRMEVYARRYASESGTAAGALGRRVGPEWDWYDRLEAGERKRLDRRWFNDLNSTSAGAATARASGQLDDLHTALMDNRVLGPDSDAEEAAEWLVGRSRTLDSLRSINTRSAGTVITDEADALIAPLLDHRIPPSRLVAASGDPQELARLVLEDRAAELAEMAAELADEAANLLGPSYAGAGLGPAPWTMTPSSFAEEVLDLEYRLATGIAGPTDADRLAALIPPGLDTPGMPLEDLHAVISDTARVAGETIRLQ